MEESIVQEISKVFGFSQEDSKEFLNKMDMNIEADEEYFGKLLNKLQKPSIVEFPRRPQNLLPSTEKKSSLFGSLFGSSSRQKEEEGRRKAEELRHKELMTEYIAKLKKYEAAPEAENTLFVNEGKHFVLNNQGKLIRHVPSGQFGYVKRNRKSPFIYKFMRVPIHELAKDSGEKLRKIFTEPLINCILQQDPVAAPFTCKLYKVYLRGIYENKAEDIEDSFEFIFKLEDLQGDTVGDEMEKIMSHDTEENMKILFLTFGPLVEVLGVLREKYSFEHGDLHEENMMFAQKPNWNTKTDIQVKMIDFGFSSLKLGDKRYGEKSMPYSEVVFFIRKAQFGFLPAPLAVKMGDFLLKNNITNEERRQILQLFLDEYETKKGQLGGRRQTRKQKSKGRKTRKH